jgi:cytoskeletal protein CcmA (bactofilin family)
MDGILSGFLFSRKKNSAALRSDASSDAPHKNTDNSHCERSDPMRLTKNDPAPAFDPALDADTDFGFGDSNQNTSELNRTPSAVIGPKISFKGELTGEEDLLILGRVEGTIDLKGNHLIIGSQGVIKADVIAKTITVEGSVEGDIVAAEHIAIKSASQVKGNLKAERVTLEDGAKFRGSIDMDMESKPESKKIIAPTMPTSPPTSLLP